MAARTGDVEIFRLHIVTGTSASGGGKTVLYEGRKALEDALFNAALEAEASAELMGAEPESRTRRQRFVRWYKHLHGKDVPSYHVKKIIKVQQLRDGEWHELSWRIDPPEIRIGVA